VAEGTTWILGAHHLDRGYQRLDAKLRALGANVRRAKAPS
jgi:UDP-N-acetylglucosamine enolpyruvyl transferase